MLDKDEFCRIIENTERVKRAVANVGMIVLILGLIVLTHGTAWGATYEFASEDARITLYESACGKDWLNGWRQAAMTYKGKSYDACWMSNGGMVFILDSAGDLTPLPVTAFKRMAEG